MLYSMGINLQMCRTEGFFCLVSFYFIYLFGQEGSGCHSFVSCEAGKLTYGPNRGRGRKTTQG